MTLIPRQVAFVDDHAVAAGVACQVTSHDCTEVLFLPTDHYDFLGPVRVEGKTRDEIEHDVQVILAKEAEEK